MQTATTSQEPAMSITIPSATDSPQVARYTDWAGDKVYVEMNHGKATYSPDVAVTIGETEQGGDYSIDEAVDTLERIDAPAEIIEWVRRAGSEG